MCLFPDLTLCSKSADHRSRGKCFPNFSNHFCMVLLLTSSGAAFLQNSLGNGRLEKSVPKPLPFSLLQAHIATTAPSQTLKPKVSPADSSVSLLSTAALGPVYLDSLYKQVKRSRRRPLGLGLHPSVELFMFLPSKADLGFVTSQSKWLDAVVLLLLPSTFFSLEKMLKINES